MDYYMAIKRNEALTHATIWIKLENMLRERSQTCKVIYYRIPLIGNVQKSQMHRDRKQISGFQSLEEEGIGGTY